MKRQSFFNVFFVLKSTQYYKMSLNMLLFETQERVFASLETAKSFDNLCESAFVWVPKGNEKWYIMEVAFLIKCNSKEWLDTQIKERELFYAPTKSDISTRGRIR